MEIKLGIILQDKSISVKVSINCIRFGYFASRPRDEMGKVWLFLSKCKFEQRLINNIWYNTKYSPNRFYY